MGLGGLGMKFPSLLFIQTQTTELECLLLLLSPRMSRRHLVLKLPVVVGFDCTSKVTVPVD